MADDKPENQSNITPYFSVTGASEFLDFLGKALDANVTERHDGPDGKVMHAEVRINGALVMVADASEKYPPTRSNMYVMVSDVDASYNSALEAGATSESEPKDQFYGHRSGGFIDKWDNRWWVAKQIEEVSDEEMERRVKEWQDQQAQQKA